VTDKSIPATACHLDELKDIALVVVAFGFAGQQVTRDSEMPASCERITHDPATLKAD